MTLNVDTLDNAAALMGMTSPCAGVSSTTTVRLR